MLKITAYQNVTLPEKVRRPATSPQKPAAKTGQSGSVDFKSTLDAALNKTGGVTFSAHAKARLHSRGVQLDRAKIDALSKAIDKAGARGARESLVLSDEAAYVVSVTNRTVITAFDRDNLRDGVFTAIDSAVIL
jgi:flagellar operon protein